jgi:hypothetical protein
MKKKKKNWNSRGGFEGLWSWDEEYGTVEEFFYFAETSSNFPPAFVVKLKL